MNSKTFSSSSSSSALLFSHSSLFPSSNLSSSKTLISFSSSSSSFNGIGSIRRTASNSRFRPIYSSFSGDSGFKPDSGAESGSRSDFIHFCLCLFPCGIHQVLLLGFLFGADAFFFFFFLAFVVDFDSCIL